MANNNFKQLLPFNREGKELKTWLEANKDKLKNQRIFYILKANMEKGDIYKIGLSERGGNSAYGRLNDYFHFYGVTKKGHPCYGVRLHLVLANTFNPDVENSDARVRRVETKMKAHFKAEDKNARGSERFKVGIDDLFNYMMDNKLLDTTETVTNVRRTPRLAEKEQGAQDAVKRIVTHNMPKTRRGHITYEVEFYKSFKYDRNQVATPFQTPNKTLTYDEIVQLRHGSRTVDAYNKKHAFN